MNGVGNGSSCNEWIYADHVVLHASNALIAVGLLSWNSLSGVTLLHGSFIIGFFMQSVWGWKNMCAVDIFSWNFVFAFMNIIQIVYIVYMLLPTKLDPKIVCLYENIFQPLRVSRVMFKKLIGPSICSVKTLQAGEHYALQKITNADKLGLLLSGVASVYGSNNLLHQVFEHQFLDSPEFESGISSSGTYEVSIIAETNLLYIHWSKNHLDSFLLKEPYLGIIMSLLIGRDVTNKLYALNDKVHSLSINSFRRDIRLPVLASRRSGTHSDGVQSSINLSLDTSCISANGTTADDCSHGNRQNYFDFNELANVTPDRKLGRRVDEWVGSVQTSPVMSANDVYKL